MNGGLSKTEPALTCQDERRRHEVRAAKGWNGLDYLEVGEDQRTLTVFFLGKAPLDLLPDNVSIRACGGGWEVRVVELRLCVLEDPERDDCLHVTVDRPGGFSPYELCLIEVVEGRPTGGPYPGFDRRYACLEFSFKVDCPSDLDCKDERACPDKPRQEPTIHYLAKDYVSFRQLLFDRLALTLPDWRERHVPDLGVALVEVLAYAGDHLSYYQDTVATEAYLDTARRRISVRRHVRLVDYSMHEGCNARAWVFVETLGGDPQLDAEDFYCITPIDAAPPGGKPLDDDDLVNVPADRYLVFAPMAEAGSIKLREAHNEIALYGWGDGECCLLRGATGATLVDGWVKDEKDLKDGKDPKDDKDGENGYGGGHEACEPPTPAPEPKRRLALEAGDLVLFEEVVGPKSHDPADADPSHRHVVRLTRAEPGVDRLRNGPIVEIEWAREDALPFPLCLSSLGGEACRVLPVSVARGNVFLADHGRWIDEKLGSVKPAESEPRCEGEGRLSEVTLIADRFYPRLERAPLTFRQPLPAHANQVPASRLPAQDPRQAVPEVSLTADPAPLEAPEWSARRDLLASGPDDQHFVAEVDDDGRGHLRFGNDETGEAPRAGTAFRARYRVGNGPSGNVGAGAIRHFVLRKKIDSGVSLKPRNPLSAHGGTPPEPLAEVRLLAPHVFRERMERAVVADDYARLVEREFPGRVQRTAATLRWTGSWDEVLVAVDPFGTEENVDRLLREVRKALHRYRRIGHDVVVARAVSVALDIELCVRVRPHFLRGHVEAALLEVLGNLALPDGRRGLFHPDNLTFGQGIALSRLLAAAQAVTGVESVVAKRFERLHEGPNQEIENGFLPLGPLEIARLDNDRRFPDQGKLVLTMGGGR